jgi:hypothetical protein
VSLVETAVGAALDTTSWASLRPPIKSTGCAGPAARLWRVQLLGLLHTARQALAPSKVAEVTGEVSDVERAGWTSLATSLYVLPSNAAAGRRFAPCVVEWHA